MTDLLNLIPLPAVAAAGAALLVAILLVCSGRWHGRWSVDSSSGVQKVHQQPTARIGGVAIVAGVLTGYLLAHPARQGLLLPLLLAGAPAFIFGLAEDLTKRVSVRSRLLATLVCGALGWAITGHSITDVNVPGVDWLLGFTAVSVIFTAFAVGGVANAFNIVDGFNGLASGTAIIVLSGLGLVANQLGDVDITRTCFIVGGAVIGFVLVNWPWGKIFLGDGGAYFLGFAVAWMAIILVAHQPEVSAWCPLLLCSGPVLEVCFTILRRWRRRGKLGAPDALHLHSLVKRRLTRRLLPNASRVVRNSVTGAIMCGSSVLPAFIAVHWATDTPTLVLAFAGCALLYSSTYARLTQFRWCLSALTLHRARTAIA